jgi:Cd2+/Zn2+-exporting ATPase
MRSAPNEKAAARLQFKIHGMDCADEVLVLKHELGPIVGGEQNLGFDLLNGTLTIAGSSGVPPVAVVEAVARTGLTAEVWRDGSRASDDGSRRQRSRAAMTVASGVLLVVGFAIHIGISGSVAAALGTEGLGVAHDVPWSARLAYGLAIVTGAWYVLPKALLALRRLRPDMNLLMLVAVAGAVGIGEWFEAATVSFLFAVSLSLESWSVGRARRAVEALMDLAPPTVRLLSETGEEKEVPPEEATVGARFIVKPGERFALDGRVFTGASEVSQAPITGESLPVPKGPGDEVFAGTINGDGALVVECTKAAADTTLAGIVRMVGEARTRRSPSEMWVEKFARIYTPVVMGLALAVLMIPTLLFDGAWSVWLYRALVLLVIACPCALVISTPVSIVASLAAAARHGVLVKGGEFVESPGRLNAIAFDKTGTLTTGRLAVVEVVPSSGHDDASLLERAAALEARSDHPIARAIVDFAKQRGVPIRPADDFQIFQGKGATGRLEGDGYWLGSHRFLEERKQETEDVHRRAEALARSGRTVVVVGDESHVCGLIALADSVRPAASDALKALRSAGVRHLIMLTGDNRPTAEVIGRDAGVDEVLAELLPADKVAAVESLVARYGQVAMVGDGINDAPAMGRATVGIAMGAAGSDAAREAADIALMSDDLGKLPWLIQHSRRTLTIVRQNIAFSLSVKVMFVVLTLVGTASLWSAIAADMGASLVVILNGLRLLRPATEVAVSAV